MKGRGTLLAAVALALSALAATPASAATPVPAWSVQALASPTNFKPGDASGLDTYEAFVTNSGGETTNHSQITIVDTLPAGLGVKSVELQPPRTVPADSPALATAACKTTLAGEVSTVTCKVTDALAPALEPAKFFPGDQLRVAIHVSTPLAASGPLVNLVEVKGGGAAEPPALAESENQASPEEKAAVGFQEFHSELTDAEGQAVVEAGAHPYQYSTSFAVNVDPAPADSPVPFVPSGGDLRDVEVGLPPGLAGNPLASERCKAQDFTTSHGVPPTAGNGEPVNACPNSSVVGVIMVEQLEGKGGRLQVPIYNLVPPHGMPAQLGFQVAALPVYINTKVRSDGDYGFTGYLQDITEAKRITAARTIIWGTPADPSHDPLRGSCLSLGGSCPAEFPERPFWRLPTSCADPLAFTMDFDTWALPSAGASAALGLPAPVACAAPDFSPEIESQPTTNLADSPTGLRFHLTVPHEAHEAGSVGEADLRDASVTLPEGLLVNPAAAEVIAACSPEQVGLSSAVGARPVHFDLAAARCPAAAKIGTVSAATPLLDHPLEGSVYLASQERNPFGSLLALYLVLEDAETGIVAKLAGRASADPVSGQLTTVVAENPQAPIEDVEIELFGGARSTLRTPPSCGTHTTTSELVPWTAPTGATAHRVDSFQISAGPAGPCPTGALAPALRAGLANPTAATYSPFGLRLTRADGTGEFTGLSVSAPAGFTANLSGVPYCPEAAIALAAARSHPGQGAAEAAAPSCPPASRVGSVTAGAGAGPTPFYTSGPVYLAGPYKGAPLSIVAVIPAVAGPFDLGVVVDRVALRIDPETAQVTSVADPLPRILAGIPLDVRDIRVSLDRPHFTLAPTNCEAKSVGATVFGPAGTASVSDRFQVGGCAALGFKPSISLRLKGGTKRGDHPAFSAVLTYPQGAYANVARASVALPHSEFLEQSHIRTICTRVQFAANACPPGSIYGKARAITPLLDKPLEGPVYLRSSANPLPDVVLDLHGQVDAVAVGRIDSKNGGVRTTFDAVPDVPLSKVVLTMQGAAKGLFVNSRDICATTNRATVKLSGQNGKAYDFRPALKAKCPAGKKSKSAKRSRHR